jgi:DNA end-binding protein Ku
MRLLILGALAGTILAWFFRDELLALGRSGAAKAERAVGAVRGGGSDDGTPLEELTKEELYERAQAADIPGRSHMSKDELIAALRGQA